MGTLGMSAEKKFQIKASKVGFNLVILDGLCRYLA
jgi:hypothetical protein